MDKDEFLKALAQAFLCFAISAAIAFALVGCKTIYTPVDVHDNDSVRVEVRVDTFYKYTRDSIIVQMPCSDSISVAYVYKYHTDTIYKSRVMHDTIAVSKCDTIYQAVEVEVPVKYVPKYYHVVSWLFWILVVAFLGITGWRIYKRFIF